MISTVALFWALCVVCIVNMARYFSSLRALLVVLRNCDPLLYQYVDGGGFFTSHGQPNNRCVSFGISMPNVIAIITMMSLFAAVSGCVGSLF
ncbi:universal stress protein B [Escherichia coli]|uniref:Universal stress protein B n=1 Tax=Escherichia coli TaxID=562 RepID=A0A376VAB3_ECOLX|nr:universal stress protein B [Escherichia coli]